jgi:hypothetical protein
MSRTMSSSRTISPPGIPNGIDTHHASSPLKNIAKSHPYLLAPLSRVPNSPSAALPPLLRARSPTTAPRVARSATHRREILLWHLQVGRAMRGARASGVGGLRGSTMIVVLRSDVQMSWGLRVRGARTFPGTCCGSMREPVKRNSEPRRYCDPPVLEHELRYSDTVQDRAFFKSERVK